MILSTDLAPEGSLLAGAAFLADLEAAFFLPLTPLTLGAMASVVSWSFLSAAEPFSWTKMSWILTVAVLPSLKLKSLNSSPLPVLTIPPSTLVFFPPSAEILAISGRDSCLVLFATDY